MRIVYFDGTMSFSDDVHLFIMRCIHVFVTDLLFDLSNMGLSLVVPWSLDVDLQDTQSEPRSRMGKIVQNKVRQTLIH